MATCSKVCQNVPKFVRMSQTYDQTTSRCRCCMCTVYMCILACIMYIVYSAHGSQQTDRYILVGRPPTMGVYLFPSGDYFYSDLSQNCGWVGDGGRKFVIITLKGLSCAVGTYLVIEVPLFFPISGLFSIKRNYSQTAMPKICPCCYPDLSILWESNSLPG